MLFYELSPLDDNLFALKNQSFFFRQSRRERTALGAIRPIRKSIEHTTINEKNT